MGCSHMFRNRWVMEQACSIPPFNSRLLNTIYHSRTRTRYERERILGLWSKLRHRDSPHSPEHHRSESFGGRLQNGQSLLCIITFTYETILIELSKTTFRMCSKRGRIVAEFQCIEQAFGIFSRGLMCIPSQIVGTVAAVLVFLSEI